MMPRGATPSPRSPAALEAKIAALEARLRLQSDELQALREAHAQLELEAQRLRRINEQQEQHQQQEPEQQQQQQQQQQQLQEQQQAADVLPKSARGPPPADAEQSSELSDLERATQRLQRARPQAAALEHAIKTLVETIAKTGPRDAVDVTDAAGAGSETDGAAVADDRSKMARDQAVAELRGLVLHAHALTRGAQSALSSLVPPSPRTSRAGYLLSLGELVGPPPDRTWRDEWVALNVEAFRLSGRHQYANAAHVSKNETPERWIGNFVSTIDGQVNRGWPREQAEVYCLLGSSSNAITAALLERSDRYAACTYALNEALWRMHDRVDPAQPLYWHRTGEHSLTEDDPVWERLEEPDETGYCGVTCSSLVLAARTAQAFSERGLATRVADGVSVKMVTMESDVVCFESHPTDSFGAHTAVLTTSKGNGAFPPNTQFQLKEIKGPGEWEAPHDGHGPKIRPKQRLLVVTCTFQPPTLDGSGRLAQRVASFAPKMACGAVLMGFGRREAFATGLDGLCDQPLLTLAEEFDRDLSWTDGEGVVHCCRDEWKYVVGPAAPLAIPSLGMTRDALNAGKTAADFLREANALIWERRRMGHFSLPEANALLSMEEVLSVRLFSGPCFRPINDFLRGIAAATGEQRRELARHAGLTFAATVGHLCAAIRKLADVVTPEEASTPLWAGMRGEPPRSFWVPEENAPLPELNAVTTAFLSTSRLREEAIRRMQDAGGNILWELAPTAEDDNGFHRGASIEMLSQFACEGECLFPPGTMLAVRGPAATNGVAGGTGGEIAKELTEGRKRFRPLPCTPTFL